MAFGHLSSSSSSSLFGLHSSPSPSPSPQSWSSLVLPLRRSYGQLLSLRSSPIMANSSDSRKRGWGIAKCGRDMDLERELEAAVCSEDYARAAELRDRLRSVQQSNRAGVISANANFYKAFETGNLTLMEEVWSKGENVHCIHPGAACISGHDLVMASWGLVLGPDLDLPLQIQLENMEVHVKGDMGFVTCLEVVRTNGLRWGKQVATNVFEKQNGIWYLCIHHASHIGN